ncbi:I78 family peptidase inhibitor [Erythrobacter oryzae]|uniref:I78 family peptidase inhibitor n=1 Tax=Erythrobacter oryzae TaxID=3019556 RepID=UPI002556F6A9|nr:I78 family peptidase inhibitor [Erythrobacter sp. COR-2]
MKHILIAALAAAGLAGCATTGSAPDQAAAMTCKADPAQYHIGHDATQAMGTAILKDSGARTLRWGPPNSAWTMDYREDRVNVRYDDKMKITGISCG